MKKINIIATICFLLLSAVCIFAITTCTKTPTIQDGIWTGSGEGFQGEMVVQITTKDGKIVDSVKNLAVGDNVDLVLADGKAKSTITEIEV